MRCDAARVSLDALLTTCASWRCEPGISQVHVWLSDGSGVGVRDLVSGVDRPAAPEMAALLCRAADDFVASYGVPRAVWGPSAAPPEAVRGWWRRRRALRTARRAESVAREWWLDHPMWVVPTDPPNGGWRDLVRNEPGRSVWERAETLPPASRWDAQARRERHAWTAGAVGEELVARELWRLARHSEWRFVNSVPVGRRGADVDHVLVGPGGVFTLNTKNHRGANVWLADRALLVNRRRTDYLRNSRSEAERATRLLSRACGFEVEVEPVIVLIDPGRLTIRGVPEDVDVITRLHLHQWASRSPRVLSADQIEAVFAAARRSSTWSH